MNSKHTGPYQKLLQGIRMLEAADFDSVQPSWSEFAEHAQSMVLVEINGFSASAAPGRSSVQIMGEFLSGLHAVGQSMCVALQGSPGRIGFQIGFRGGCHPDWADRIRAFWPGCSISSESSLPRGLRTVANLPFRAFLSGNPSPTRIAPTGESPADILARALPSANWSWVTFLHPVAHSQSANRLKFLRHESQEVASAFLRPGTTEEHNNPLARRYLTLLEAAIQKVEAGLTIGLWDAQSALLTDSDVALRSGGQALLSALAGEDCVPQPIRIQTAVPSGERMSHFTPGTLLPSREAALFTAPPTKEQPGLLVRPSIRFDVAPPAVRGVRQFTLGPIMDQTRIMSNSFAGDVDWLASHCLIAGTTGSGKTTTAHLLLRQVWEMLGIAWLVIEPSTKAEYRALLGTPTGRNLLIYTAGNENACPLRINPLEVPAGISVQTHIDSLIALFTAAFAWVTPLPYVLAQALQKTYERAGWNLTTGMHPNGHSSDAQPTISDLLLAVEEVVRGSGFDAEITSNIRASIGTRLRGLTIGAKGAMLNGRDATSFAEILRQPAIIELSAIGNDEEKAFLLGLILLRISQIRQASGLSENGLRHLLVIEEAHRLLRAAPENRDVEIASPAAKAVEMFSNLLSEVRAYGQGIVVLEQIPAKLAPDVIKNTDIKIIHRLSGKDDRDAIGASAAMSQDRIDYLASLRNGEAVVSVASARTVCHIQVPDHRKQFREPLRLPPDAAIREHMLLLGRVPASPRTEQPGIRKTESGQRTATGPAIQAPLCPGCDNNSCRLRARALSALGGVHNPGEFERALQQGWEALFEFGRRVARAEWNDEAIPAEAPYCILMNLAALLRWSPESTAKLRRNLRVILKQRPRQPE